ncbi:terminase [Enterobacter sp. CGMCC 5087]|uniref:phage terminase small subunit n=1 Tax=Enterobacter sp. CGMCC 5087 TaxID=2183878 RepID=UPI000D67606F|nr:phage terminase small subunit [Enterobacter sp. CGMCC 5087]PWI80499.1 terminase [Enterobacter sp. CGMCC 5087]
MKLTPAQKHWQFHAAAEAAKRPEGTAHSTEWERMYHRFRHDKKRLGDIQGTTRKIELKRELLPSYQGWIGGIMSSNSGRPDEIFITCVIWHIDTGQVEEALPLIEHALRHKMPVPDQYKRTPAALIVEEICNPALTALKVGDPCPLTPELLSRLGVMTQEEDMPDQVRSKLHKLIGLLLMKGDEEQQRRALENLTQATRLNPDAGVKKEIDALRRAAAKRNAPAKNSAGTRKHTG